MENTHGLASVRANIPRLAAQARAAVQPPLSANEQSLLEQEITTLLSEQNAVLVAHYYVNSELQDLAEATGGYVADSLEMARLGLEHPASTVVVAGVRFMGETAKILKGAVQIQRTFG